MKKYLMRLAFYAFVLSAIFMACTETNDPVTPEPQPEPEPEPVDTVFTVNRENQYAVNVVFFRPSDYQNQNDVRLVDNISKMMLFMQQWYEKQMELQGYGTKTFGLMTKNGKVNIIRIEAPEPSWYYDNDYKIMDLINQHFEEFPEDKQSDHTFVLGQDQSGVGFHGRGRWAFATSGDDFNVKPTGKFLDDMEFLAADKLGGIMHEFGHGINLSHNAHKASDLPSVSLMSFGNRRYNQNLEEFVFLTKGDCAILNTSQVFNTKDKIYYQDELQVTLKSYSVSKDDVSQAAVIQGIIASNLKMTDFIVGHDGLPAGGNNGYDRITWCDQLVPTENPDEYSFYAKMPYSDIFNNYGPKDSLAFTVDVLAENGRLSQVVAYVYTMNEVTRVPNDDIVRNYAAHTFTDRSKWSVTANTVAPYSDTTVENMIDGDKSTNWMCNWPYSIAQSGNHVITAFMGEDKTISGIYWLSTKSGNQFRPKHVIIETSDDGANWSIVKEVAVESMQEAKEAFVNFDNPVNASYFRLTVDQVYSDNTTDNLIISELDIY